MTEYEWLCGKFWIGSSGCLTTSLTCCDFASVQWEAVFAHDYVVKMINCVDSLLTVNLISYILDIKRDCTSWIFFMVQGEFTCISSFPPIGWWFILKSKVKSLGKTSWTSVNVGSMFEFPLSVFWVFFPRTLKGWFYFQSDCKLVWFHVQNAWIVTFHSIDLWSLNISSVSTSLLSFSFTFLSPSLCVIMDITASMLMIG